MLLCRIGHRGKQNQKEIVHHRWDLFVFMLNPTAFLFASSSFLPLVNNAFSFLFALDRFLCTLCIDLLQLLTWLLAMKILKTNTFILLFKENIQLNKKFSFLLSSSERSKQTLCDMHSSTIRYTKLWFQAHMTNRNLCYCMFRDCECETYHGCWFDWFGFDPMFSRKHEYLWSGAVHRYADP